MASPLYSMNNPDSLSILLQKAHAIKTINQENLTFIKSRKGQKVVIQHKYSIQTKQPSSSAKRQKTQYHDITSNNTTTTQEIFTLIDKKCTKNVDDIVSSWRYFGEPLTKEKFAIDDFINRNLVGYEDLVRLHTEYNRLLNQYSRVLADEPECRLAVEGVLRNLEVLQVAIGEIHMQLLDVVESELVNNAITSLVKDLSKTIYEFQSKVSGFVVDFQGQIVEQAKEASLVNFYDCAALTYRQTLSLHHRGIIALESYVLNNETFLLSVGENEQIKHWNLSNNTLIASLSDDTNCIRAMALYFQNDVYMLAGGSSDKTIKIWDLSRNVQVQTLSGHNGFIFSLAVYEQDDKTILISGSTDNTIKLWNLQNNNIITTLHGHEHTVRALSVYTYYDTPYLASGSFDKKIKIWSLEDCSLVKTIDTDCVIFSVVVVDLVDKKILASGDMTGQIKLWRLDDYVCMDTIQAHLGIIWTFNVLRCNGNVCLASTGNDKTVKIWSLQNNSIMKTIDNCLPLQTTQVFMNGDQACLASGDCEGNIKFWTE